MKKWLVIGDIADYDKFNLLVSRFETPDLVMSDGAKGAAAFALRWAHNNNVESKKVEIREGIESATIVLSVSKDKKNFMNPAIKMASDRNIKIIELLESDISSFMLAKSDRYGNTGTFKEIELNGVKLSYDEKHMTPIVAFVIELKKEIDKIKESIDK